MNIKIWGKLWCIFHYFNVLWFCRLLGIFARKMQDFVFFSCSFHIFLPTLLIRFILMLYHQWVDDYGSVVVINPIKQWNIVLSVLCLVGVLFLLVKLHVIRWEGCHLEHASSPTNNTYIFNFYKKILFEKSYSFHILFLIFISPQVFTGKFIHTDFLSWLPYQEWNPSVTNNCMLTLDDIEFVTYQSYLLCIFAFADF